MIDPKITKILTPINYDNGTIDRIKYIVIHYVGALGGARANCNYYASAYRGASAHYYVDFDGSYFQSVEDRNVAWHCGTKKGYKHPTCRNSNSIGIEMCVRNKGSQADTSHDWFFEDATVAATIELTKYLMAKYNIPAENVIRHHDVTGKICPNPYVYDSTKHTWAAFKAAISAPVAPPVIKAGWRKAADGIRYWWERSDGSYPAKRWAVINHHWYLFDENGYMLTGWQQWDSKTQERKLGHWYYLNDTVGGPLEGACYHEIEDKDGGLDFWYVDGPDTV